MDRRPWVTGVVALATVLGAPFAAIPVVRGVVGARARAMGLDVSVREVRPVLGTVHLRDVTVRARGVPGASLALAYVDVRPTLGAPHLRIEVHGGSATLTGSLAEFRAELDTFRKARAGPRDARDRHARRTPVLVDGIDAHWTGATAAGDTQHAWGLRYERTAAGEESVSVDLLRTGTPTAELEVTSASAHFEPKDGSRSLTHLAADSIRTTLTLPGGPAAPALASAPAAPAPSPVGARLCSFRSDLVRAVTSLLHAASEVSVSNVRFTLRSGAQSLNIGPATVVVGRDPSGDVRLGLASSRSEAGTPVTFSARLPEDGAETALEFSGGPLPLAALGVGEGDMGLLEVSRSELVLSGHVRLATDCHAAAWDGSARFERLSLLNPKLSPDALRDLDVGMSASGEATLDGSRIVLSALEATLGRARLRASGALERAAGHTRGNLRVEVPPTACSDIAESVPPALAPLFSGIRLEGTATLTAAVSFDTRRLADTRVSWDGENLCRFTAVPASASPARFRGAWERTVRDANDLPLVVESGPGTPSWVAYTELPKSLTTAVLVCEDSRFFSHHGLDPRALSDALKDDLRAGRFVRGGSTVTMQLAKNLFLGREKTLSRKLQEAALTLLLEQSFTKEELLELYLNVVELGPGVYGVGPAAEYYFKIPAQHLSLAQAFYLVSLLPNPKNDHFAKDGSLHPAWAGYLKKLMGIGQKIGRVDDAALAAGLAEDVRLASVASAPPSGASDENPPEVPDTEATPQMDEGEGASGP